MTNKRVFKFELPAKTPAIKSQWAAIFDEFLFWRRIA